MEYLDCESSVLTTRPQLKALMNEMICIGTFPIIIVLRHFTCRFNYTKPQLVSNIMDVRVLNSDSCQEVSMDNRNLTGPPLSISLQVDSINVVSFKVRLGVLWFCQVRIGLVRFD